MLQQTKGLDQFKHPTINTLPTALRGAVKAGWYEGSVFFAIMGTTTCSSLSLDFETDRNKEF